MTTIESLGGEVEDPGEGSSLRGGGAGLVLPEGVLADLAEQLAARARAGEPAELTGPGGLLTGLIGQVLQAGLTAELGAHLEAGDGENRRNGASVKTLNTEVGPGGLAGARGRARAVGAGPGA